MKQHGQSLAVAGTSPNRETVRPLRRLRRLPVGWLALGACLLLLATVFWFVFGEKVLALYLESSGALVNPRPTLRPEKSEEFWDSTARWWRRPRTVLIQGKSPHCRSLLSMACRLDALERIELTDYSLTTVDVRILLKLPKLKSLVLLDCDLRGVDLSPLRSLPALEEIDLSGSRWGDETVRQLSECPRLQRLTLDDVRIRRNQLLGIERFPELQRLSLCGSQIEESALKPVRQCAKLRIVELQMTRVADQLLQDLAAVRSLAELNVTGGRVENEALQTFREARPDVELICPSVSPAEGENQ